MEKYIWAFPTAEPTEDGQLSITRRLVNRETGKEAGATLTVRPVSIEVQRKMPTLGTKRRWWRRQN